MAKRNYFAELEAACAADGSKGLSLEFVEKFAEETQANQLHGELIETYLAGGDNQRDSEDAAMDFRDACRTYGFNAGYELGFSRGLLALAKAHKLDTPVPQDILGSVKP